MSLLHTPNGRPPSKASNGKQDTRSSIQRSVEEYDQMADLGPQRMKDLPLSDGPKLPYFSKPSASLMNLLAPKLSSPRKIDPAWAVIVEESENVDCPGGLGTGDSYRHGPNFRPLRLVRAQRLLQQQASNPISINRLPAVKKPPLLTPQIVEQGPAAPVALRPRGPSSFVTRIVRQAASVPQLNPPVLASRARLASNPNADTAQYVPGANLREGQGSQQLDSWNAGKLAVASEIAYDYETASGVVRDSPQLTAAQTTAAPSLSSRQPLVRGTAHNSETTSTNSLSKVSPMSNGLTLAAEDHRLTPNTPKSLEPSGISEKRTTVSQLKPSTSKPNAWQQAISAVSNSKAIKPVSEGLSDSKYAIVASNGSPSVMKADRSRAISAEPLKLNAAFAVSSLAIASEAPKVVAPGLSQSKYAIPNTASLPPSSTATTHFPTPHKRVAAIASRKVDSSDISPQNKFHEPTLYANLQVKSETSPTLMASSKKAISTQQDFHQTVDYGRDCPAIGPITHTPESSQAEKLSAQQGLTDVQKLPTHQGSPHVSNSLEPTQRESQEIVDLLDMSENITITYPVLRPLSTTTSENSDSIVSPDWSLSLRQRYGSMCLVSGPLEHTTNSSAEMISLQPALRPSQRRLIERFEKQAILIERRRAWEEAEMKYKEIQQELRILDEEDLTSESDLS